MGEHEHGLADRNASHGAVKLCLGWIAGPFDPESEKGSHCCDANETIVSLLSRRWEGTRVNVQNHRKFPERS